jgi:uncharacterized membrane protein YdjX (TVP38/TMEM64 family)
MLFNFTLRTSLRFRAYIIVTSITEIGAWIEYVITTTQMGETMIKTMWTVAALLAVAAIPIYLVRRKKAEIPVAGDANDIFEWDKQPWE